jgi:hypothetical protein
MSRENVEILRDGYAAILRLDRALFDPELARGAEPSRDQSSTEGDE